jgi:hypothetical protein
MSALHPDPYRIVMRPIPNGGIFHRTASELVSVRKLLNFKPRRAKENQPGVRSAHPRLLSVGPPDLDFSTPVSRQKLVNNILKQLNPDCVSLQSSNPKSDSAGRSGRHKKGRLR